MNETALGRDAASPGLAARLPLVLRLAVRELRSSLAGFIVFVACIALGVAAIAGIGSLAGAIRGGLALEGQQILGGDVAASLVHRRGEPEQLAYFQGYGTVSEMASLRAMARDAQGGNSALIRLKAVDDRYPLYGTVGQEAAAPHAWREPGQVIVEQLLLERLGVKVGDAIRIGSADIRIAGVLEREPDQLSARPAFGPRVLMSLETLQQTDLIQPGSLINWRYRVKMQDASDENLAAFRTALEKRFPDAGFSVRDRRDPNPRMGRVIDRFAQFMTLVGITTLMIGGIGVANAIAAYLARKRSTIAAFKCLGASGGTIFRIYLVEVLLLAGAGTVIGLAVGAALPHAAVAIAGDALPFRLAAGVQPFALLLAAVYGMLTALLFVLWPLGQARDVSAALLLRQTVSGEAARPRWPYVAASAACAVILAGIAVAGAESAWLAAWAVAGLVALFVFFLGMGWLVERVARRLPRPRRPEFSLARASLAGPGGLARPVVLSLGAALSLLAAVSLVNHSLKADLKGYLPEDAPSYYMLDIPRGEVDAFTALVKKLEPDAAFNRAPMLRGRIVKVKDQRARDVKPAANAAWVLNGDRGLTYAEDVPEGSRLVAGEWWQPGYDGPPLVSFERDIAEGLGLAIGDTVTVNVLGRNVEAKIANLRDVDWDSLAINFVMVFSPNVLAGAPHNFLATVRLPDEAGADREARLTQALGQDYPGVTALRVRDAIDAFRQIAERVLVAIQAASGVTLLVGAIVLAGALAVAHPRRMRETVIFKTLGATRRRIVVAHIVEYASLALAAGVAAAALGTFAAWAVVHLVMDAPFTFSWGAMARPILFAAGLVLAFGALGTWRILGANPARQLRRSAG